MKTGRPSGRPVSFDTLARTASSAHTTTRIPNPFLAAFGGGISFFAQAGRTFFTHQDEQTKAALREKYNFKKYQ